CWSKVERAAQTVALRASPVGAIKRERSWLKLRHIDSAIRTSQPLGVELLLSSDNRNQHQTACQFHGQANRHLKPLLNPWLHQEPINDHFNGVILALVELDLSVVLQIHQFAVNTRAAEPMLGQLLQFFLEF